MLFLWQQKCFMLGNNLEGCFVLVFWFFFSMEERTCVTGHCNDGAYALEDGVALWMPLNASGASGCMIRAEKKVFMTTRFLGCWRWENGDVDWFLNISVCFLKRKGCPTCYSCGRKMFSVGRQLRRGALFMVLGWFFFNGRNQKKAMYDRPLHWWHLCPWQTKAGWSGPWNAFECFRCFWVHAVACDSGPQKIAF